MKRIIPILLVVAVFAGYFFLKKSKSKVLIPVETVKVEYGDVRNIVEATGIIKPQVGAEVKVGARISGTVIQENVKVGDEVKKGDLIAVIDNRELRESLEQAKANLETVKKTYPKKIRAQELSVSSAKANLNSAKAKLRSERSNFDLKKWKFEREKELYKEGYSTQERLRKAKTEYIAAKESLKSAEESLKKAELDLKIALEKLEELKREFKSKLKAAEAEVKQRKVRLSYSYIYAPIDGVISYVSTQKGETVVAGLNAPEFVTILNPERLENWVYVDETEIGKVKKGMNVEFTVDAYRGKVFKGKVEEIYPKPKVLNNVVYFTVVVRGFRDVNLLHPEMTTHNRIVTGTRKHVLIVPNSAVKWKNGRYIVYKVVGGKVKIVPVKVGWSDERFTQVLEGLKEGDTVATSVRPG